MNPIKRIAISLNATVDQFLCQVENHEAVAELSIRDAEKSAQHAKAQFRRIQLSHQRLQRREVELNAVREMWKGRAIKMQKEGDEEGALECVRRIKLAERELEQVREQSAQYANIEAQLSGDLRHVEVKLGELRMKRNMLAGRAAKSDAIQAIGRVTSETGASVEGVFERWEAKIEADAPFNGEAFSAGTDAFEAKLRREEEKDGLKAALQALVDEK